MADRLRILRMARRTLWQAVPTVFGILLLNFLLLRLIPGDAVDVLASESGGATEATLAQWRSHFGLDLNLWQQLLAYLNHLAHLDLGLSPRFNVPVIQLVLERLPNTLVLMVSALALALVVGIAAGAVMASKAGRWPDRVLSLAVLLLYFVQSVSVGTDGDDETKSTATRSVAHTSSISVACSTGLGHSPTHSSRDVTPDDQEA